MGGDTRAWRQRRCEPCPGELFEQLLGNREPEVGSVLVSLLCASSTDDSRRHGRMGEYELQCRRGQGNAVAIANRTDAVYLLDDRTWCRDVVQVCSRARVGEDAAAVDPGRQHRHPPLLTRGEEPVCRRDVEEGIAAGDQHAVELRPLDEPSEHVGVVHGDADCANHAIVAELLKGRIRLGERQLGVLVRIVDQRDINVVAT